LFGIEVGPGLGSATGNLVEGNTANGNSQGILVLDGATSNTIRLNTATGNSVVDLNDSNSACDANVWTTNTFITDLVAGISDGGPGIGCIQ
jgi:parallel beta-helix repeat protein